MKLPLGYHIGDGIDGMVWLPEDSVDLILTDPPYRDYQSNRTAESMRAPKVNRWSRYEMESFIYQAYRVLKPGRHLYCFSDHNQFGHICDCLQAYNFKIMGVIYWIKNNHGCGDLKASWANRVELIIHAANKKEMSSTDIFKKMMLHYCYPKGYVRELR